MRRRRGRAAQAGSLPDDATILEALVRLGGRAALRDVARALHVPRGLHTELRRRLRELEAHGPAMPRPRAEPARHQAAHAGATPPLPEIAIVTVSETDLDGELKARPASWTGRGAPPPIYLAPAPAGLTVPALGDRLVARLRPLGDGSFEATPLKQLEPAGERILGVFEETPRGGLIHPADRRRPEALRVARGEAGGAGRGELVLAEVTERPRFGPAEARIVGRLGDADEPGAFSLIALHAANIPSHFPKHLIASLEGGPVPSPAGRDDLRGLPLVTIDDEDARDFDDAVFAEPDPERPGGFHLIVAIADVAWYVRPGDPVDREAERRGNSVYFPDRVVPMLPERLSNELCSLRPGEDRPCLAAHLWIDSSGRLVRQRFGRAVMRSAARLTYAEVQRAADARPDPVVANLFAAFRPLDAAAVKRGMLRLDLPELRVVFDPAGRPVAVRPRPRYDSHRLIEQFMIAANVAAAQTLERARQPCMYRVHDQPDAAKVEALRELFAELDLSLGRRRSVSPADFNRVLARAAGTPVERLVHETVLRAQAQAVYSPRNIGHYGLALGRYAHFTSPIRRYADLLVHRALIQGLKLGEGGLDEAARFAEIGEHISMTERRAAAAERETVARFAALLMADRVGATFAATVTGVTRFGLFVTVEETGAEGLLPIGALGGKEFFRHDEERHALVGARSGRAYRLGDRIEVVLREVAPLAGRLTFDPA